MDGILKYNDIDVIRDKIIELKQSDGEGWAVGNFIDNELEIYLCQEN
jgi:hypothetical protein